LTDIADDAAIRPRERWRGAIANQGAVFPLQFQNVSRRGKKDHPHEKGCGDSNNSERDAGGKVVSTFPHPARAH
jgi:hypothetical protein